MCLVNDHTIRVCVNKSDYHYYYPSFLSLIGVSPGCPSERVMVIAQIQNVGFRAVFRKAGIRGLYHGAEATLHRDITFNMCLFVMRAYIMKWYEDCHGMEPGPLAKVWYGLPASVSAGIVTCPMDVVKTRIQGEEIKEFGTSKISSRVKI